jgi:colicin import membrane protein
LPFSSSTKGRFLTPLRGCRGGSRGAARGWHRLEPLVSASGELAARERRRVDEEVRALRERLTKGLAEEETRHAFFDKEHDADASSTAKLPAANAARGKAAREIAEAERKRNAAQQRRVAAEAALVAERNAASAARARKLVRAEAKQAESMAWRAEIRAYEAAMKAKHRAKRFAFATWRSAAAEAERARDVAETGGGGGGAVSRAQGAAGAAALAAAATRALEEAAAAEHAAAMETEMTCVAETWRASKLVAADVAA